MGSLLEGIPQTHMSKTTPGRYIDRDDIMPDTVCDDCLCKRCAQTACHMRPQENDCSDVCINRGYVVTSCTSFVPRADEQ